MVYSLQEHATYTRIQLTANKMPLNRNLTVFGLKHQAIRQVQERHAMKLLSINN